MRSFQVFFGLAVLLVYVCCEETGAKEEHGEGFFSGISNAAKKMAGFAGKVFGSLFGSHQEPNERQDITTDAISIPDEVKTVGKLPSSDRDGEEVTRVEQNMANGKKVTVVKTRRGNLLDGDGQFVEKTVESSYVGNGNAGNNDGDSPEAPRRSFIGGLPSMESIMPPFGVSATRHLRPLLHRFFVMPLHGGADNNNNDGEDNEIGSEQPPVSTEQVEARAQATVKPSAATTEAATPTLATVNPYSTPAPSKVDDALKFSANRRRR